jgi:hypothetical protein
MPEVQGANTPWTGRQKVKEEYMANKKQAIASSVPMHTQYLLRASYLEVYNEQINDLLGERYLSHTHEYIAWLQQWGRKLI